MKSLRVTTNVKAIKFVEIFGELESKKNFPETISHKIFETHYSFYVKNRITGKLLFLFFKSFNKKFILIGRLVTALSFYEVYTLS